MFFSKLYYYYLFYYNTILTPSLFIYSIYMHWSFMELLESIYLLTGWTGAEFKSTPTQFNWITASGFCWPWLLQRQGPQRLGVYEDHTAVTTQSILVAGYRFEALYFLEPLWVVPQRRNCRECKGSLALWFWKKSLYLYIFHPLRTATISKNMYSRLHVTDYRTLHITLFYQCITCVLCT